MLWDSKCHIIVVVVVAVIIRTLPERYGSSSFRKCVNWSFSTCFSANESYQITGMKPIAVVWCILAHLNVLQSKRWSNSHAQRDPLGYHIKPLHYACWLLIIAELRARQVIVTLRFLAFLYSICYNQYLIIQHTIFNIIQVHCVPCTLYRLSPAALLPVMRIAAMCHLCLPTSSPPMDLSNCLPIILYVCSHLTCTISCSNCYSLASYPGRLG